MDDAETGTDYYYYYYYLKKTSNFNGVDMFK